MNIEIARAADVTGGEEILTDGALAFVEELHRRFDPRRRELLAARRARRDRIAAGERLDFLPETRAIREGEWRVPPRPRPWPTAGSRSRGRRVRRRWRSTR